MCSELATAEGMVELMTPLASPPNLRRTSLKSSGPFNPTYSVRTNETTLSTSHHVQHLCWHSVIDKILNKLGCSITSSSYTFDKTHTTFIIFQGIHYLANFPTPTVKTFVVALFLRANSIHSKGL